MNTAVIVFPGSNCDRDVLHSLSDTLGTPLETVWHRESSLPEATDLVILPGGFSFGDYLRCGAMAARSPIMQAVAEHGKRGGLLLGICNGFQILTEAGLLPGALLPNRSLDFICGPCSLRVENVSTPFTSLFSKSQVVQFPIAHGDGLYTLPDEDLKRLEERGGVVFRYCGSTGEIRDKHNPNGSVNHIAGIVNPHGNILGLMPHPERATDPLLGGTDGRMFWHSILTSVLGGHVPAFQKGGR